MSSPVRRGGSKTGSEFPKIHIIWLPTPFWPGRKSDDKATLPALKQNIARLVTAKMSLIAISGKNGCAAAQGAGADKNAGYLCYDRFASRSTGSGPRNARRHSLGLTLNLALKL